MDLVLGSFCLIVGLGFVALVAVMLVMGYRAAKKRQAELSTYAAQREWRYRQVGPDLVTRFSGDPFGRGSGRSAGNVVEGVYEARPFVAFDYSYRTGTGDDSTTHRCSIVAVHLGALAGPVPTLQVSSQGPISRFFSDLFGTDLQLGDPAFDPRFHVRAASPQFAQDVLHADLRALLLAHQDRAWRLEGDSLLLFRTGAHTPAELDAVLAFSKAILDRIPPVVWERLRGEAPR